MLKKYKKEVILFNIFLLIYFSLSLLFSYYMGAYKFEAILFDFDTPRVFNDLVIFDAPHGRSTVHPLFVILFQPISKILGFILNNDVISVLLIQSLLASLSLVLFYSMIKKLKIKKNLHLPLTIIFGISFPQLVFSSNVETYIFAQFLLMLMWYFFIIKVDKEYNLITYIIIVLLGVLSLSVTITNFVQYIIFIFFMITLNKNIKNKLLTSFIIGIITVSLSVLLANVQSVIWPTTNNFFTANINGFVNGNSEELLYIEKSITFDKILNQLNANFSYSYSFANLKDAPFAICIGFANSIISNLISIILGIGFLILNVYFIKKTKFNFNKYKIYYAMLSAYLFNFIFHLFYGNIISFLFIPHYNYLLLLIVGYLLYKLKIDIKNKYIIWGVVFTLILLSIKQIYMLYEFLSLRLNVIDYFSKVPLILIFFIIMSLIIFSFRNKIFKIILLFILIILLSIFYFNINNKKMDSNCDKFCDYEKSLKKYQEQVKEFRNSYMVKNYIKLNKNTNLMFFGMGDRKKLVYKAGKIYDVNTKEVIKDIPYKSEIIIPNLYTVLLKNGKDIYEIKEDSNGVYLYTNSKKEVLSESKQKIFDFKDKKYSEILKVLYHEMLFNMDKDKIKNNIFEDSDVSYKTAMMVSMVLERVENTDIISNWVKSIDDIYDSNLKETDNLGQLLYIIGATNVDRNDLKNEIIKEINSIKVNNSLIFKKDNSTFSYYPTAVAIYGAKKAGVNIDLSLPLVDDDYTKLLWYNPVMSSSKNRSDGKRPYLNWAYYHYSGYGYLYSLDEIYPLTYDVNKVNNQCFVSGDYCKKDIILSNSWVAAEMFLYLFDF